MGRGMGKWKVKWKSPLWNFIITRNSAFANAKREEFAEMLQFLELNVNHKVILRESSRNRVNFGQYLCAKDRKNSAN